MSSMIDILNTVQTASQTHFRESFERMLTLDTCNDDKQFDWNEVNKAIKSCSLNVIFTKDSNGYHLVYGSHRIDSYSGDLIARSKFYVEELMGILIDESSYLVDENGGRSLDMTKIDAFTKKMKMSYFQFDDLINGTISSIDMITHSDREFVDANELITLLKVADETGCYDLLPGFIAHLTDGHSLIWDGKWRSIERTWMRDKRMMDILRERVAGDPDVILNEKFVSLYRKMSECL